MEIQELKKIVNLINDITNKWFIYLGWLLIVSMIRVFTVFAKDTIDIIISWGLYYVSIIMVMIYGLNFVLLTIPKKSTFLKILISSIVCAIIGILFGFISTSISDLFLLNFFLNK